MPSPEFIAAHVTAIVRRTPLEADRLARTVIARGWPTGTDDSHSEAASAWLTRWRPVRISGTVPLCECAAGRCPTCN